MINVKKPHNPNRTLHLALAEVGLSSEPSRVEGKRELLDFGVPIGAFSAEQSWEIVNRVEAGESLASVLRAMGRRKTC